MLHSFMLLISEITVAREFPANLTGAGSGLYDSIGRDGQGKNKLEHRAFRTGALDAHLAAVVLNDFLDRGEAQPGTVFLAVAHKGLEQVLAHGRRDARTVVGDANLQPLRRAADLHFDFPRIRRRGLAGVEQQVVEDALDLAGIKPAFSPAFLGKRYGNAAELRPGVDALDGALQHLAHTAI